MATDETATEEFESSLARKLQAFAAGYPEVNESPSCVNRSFKARKKSFLFLGEKDDGMLRMMVKLDDAKSIKAAAACAKADPDRWSVKGPGWVTGNFAPEAAPPADLLTAWIDESYRLQAPKALIAELD